MDGRGWPESILQLATGPNAQVLSIPVSEEPTVSGHWLIAPRDNALESATNIWLLDLRQFETRSASDSDAGDPEGSSDWESLGQYINPSSYHQSNPHLHEGYLAYEELNAEGERRIVIIKDDLRTDCGRDGHRQWGLVVAGGWLRDASNRASMPCGLVSPLCLWTIVPTLCAAGSDY